MCQSDFLKNETLRHFENIDLFDVVSTTVSSNGVSLGAGLCVHATNGDSLGAGLFVYAASGRWEECSGNVFGKISYFQLSAIYL